MCVVGSINITTELLFLVFYLLSKQVGSGVGLVGVCLAQANCSKASFLFHSFYLSVNSASRVLSTASYILPISLAHFELHYVCFIKCTMKQKTQTDIRYRMWIF